MPSCDSSLKAVSHQATQTWVSPLGGMGPRSEEHTSELQSQSNLVCRLLLEKKKKHKEPSPLTNISHPPPPASRSPSLFSRSLVLSSSTALLSYAQPVHTFTTPSVP